MTGTPASPMFLARAQSKAIPVPPFCPGRLLSSRSATQPAAAAALASSSSDSAATSASTGTCSTLMTGTAAPSTTALTSSQVSSPWSWMRSTPASATALSTRSTGWSMKTPTTPGRRAVASLMRFPQLRKCSAKSSSPEVRIFCLTGSAASRSPKARTRCTMAAACATSTWRLDLAKMAPMRLAPAAQAAAASSGDVTPQTLTRGVVEVLSASPSRFWMAAAGSAARMSASPTRMPAMPASPKFRSSGPMMPESASSSRSGSSPPKGMPSSRNLLDTRGVVSMSSLKVCRLRLFTPTTRAPARAAISASTLLATSTSGSMPSSRHFSMRPRSSERPSTATMSSTVSAPKARASWSWYSSMMKSLRRMAGRPLSVAPTSACVASRTSRMSSRLPLNHLPSVRMEMTEAPAPA
mmetsp:Transcript_25183/g.79024  ORF Transcript_25183/g.79024 Transcript_25183/m.79024 type:complete len:411 (+) Transcript_25183:301-1533(+)